MNIDSITRAVNSLIVTAYMNGISCDTVFRPNRLKNAPNPYRTLAINGINNRILDTSLLMFPPLDIDTIKSPINTDTTPIILTIDNTSSKKIYANNTPKTE